MSQQLALSMEQIEVALKYLDSKQIAPPPQELPQLETKDWEELHHLLTCLKLEKEQSVLH